MEEGRKDLFRRNTKMRNCINQVDYSKKRSVGEQIVSTILDDLGVRYYYDVPCKNLRGVKNGTLRFDFCVPLDQLTTVDVKEFSENSSSFYVIEYNGIFHYHVIKGKTTKYTLTKQQMNDYIKQAYCSERGISILWIPYWYHLNVVTDIVAKNVRNTLPHLSNDSMSS